PERIYRFLNYDYDYYQIDNFQKLNLDGLIGRYLSVTYSLKKGDPEYEKAISRLQDLYYTNQEHGEIRLKYVTKIFVGSMK
ncbi:MAG: class I SAM-dependent methyltransferase, partial [Thermoplasmata archaeon]